MSDINANPLETLQSVPDLGYGADSGMNAVHDYIFILRASENGSVPPEMEMAFKRAVLDAVDGDFDTMCAAQEYVKSEVEAGHYIELLSELGREIPGLGN